MTAKDLKNALLQEAVQGKLVPQIASEGNARDLLEEIRKARHSELVSESKNKPKKEKPLPEISEDEIPFDIPDNWCWCRLGEIVPFGTCKNAESNEIEEGDWILDLEDIEKDSGKILAFKTKKQVDAKSTKHVFIKGNVLYSKLRPYLNKCVIAPKNGFCTSEILPLDFGEHIYNKYAQLYLMSPFFVDYTNSLSFGVKMPRLGTEDGKKALFPLPPFAEQKRIVAVIEKFMPLIEEYGKKETELKAFNEQIGTLTKKAILQEAVQGKLVPQIAAEGNAKDLLEKIKKEKAKLIKEGKIKKEKPLPEITEDEIPFDIPENWCWCRLGDIVSILGDGIHGTPNYDISGNYYFVNGNNLNNGKIEIKPDTKKVNQSEYEKYKKELNKNTVFVSINGTLGNIAFYENEKIILGKSACYFNLIKNEMKKFIYWLIKTQYFLDYANQEATGTTIKNVSLAAMRNFPLPLAPLAEQKRIVAAIEKMLPLCEKLGE